MEMVREGGMQKGRTEDRLICDGGEDERIVKKGRRMKLILPGMVLIETGRAAFVCMAEGVLAFGGARVYEEEGRGDEA